VVKKKDDNQNQASDDALFIEAMSGAGLENWVEAPKVSPREIQAQQMEKEDDLFRSAMDGSLDFGGEANTPASEEQPVVEERQPKADIDNEVSEEDRALFLSSVDSLSPQLKLHEDETELRPQTAVLATKLKAVRKGTLSPDVVLDLHHQSEIEAEETLGNLLTCKRDNIEIALVIVGKGLHSRGKAVLREALPTWLNQEHRKRVIRWEWAPRHLGGHGAALIVMNRN